MYYRGVAVNCFLLFPIRLTSRCYNNPNALVDFVPKVDRICPHQARASIYRTPTTLQYINPARLVQSCPHYAMLMRGESNSTYWGDGTRHIQQYHHAPKLMTCPAEEQCPYRSAVSRDKKCICHMALYAHSKATRLKQSDYSPMRVGDQLRTTINPPILSPSAYYLHEPNTLNGFLRPLLHEVIQNGRLTDLIPIGSEEEVKQAIGYHIEDRWTLRPDGTYLGVLAQVEQVLHDPYHSAIGYPLNRGEVLALWLYCSRYKSGECGDQLSRTQQEGDYSKWVYLDYCLASALSKLQARQRFSSNLSLYSVLSKVNPVDPDQCFIPPCFAATYTLTTVDISALTCSVSDQSAAGDMIMALSTSVAEQRGLIRAYIGWVVPACEDQQEVLLTRMGAMENVSWSATISILPQVVAPTFQKRSFATERAA